MPHVEPLGRSWLFLAPARAMDSRYLAVLLLWGKKVIIDRPIVVAIR